MRGGEKGTNIKKKHKGMNAKLNREIMGNYALYLLVHHFTIAKRTIYSLQKYCINT